jgi:tetratricopeptide (TPR) repeat protein
LQHATPAAPAVRETLERLLASETFGRSERARKLLRYLVEREQAGEADKLKGFSIAMDVFGKDGDFDSSTDAVVRVQAGRLRELLQQYFANEGIAEPVRIAIPRGGYVPSYELNAIRLPIAPEPNGHAQAAAAFLDLSEASGAAATALPVAVAPVSGHSVLRHLQFFWVAITLVIVMLAVLILRQGGGAVGDAVTADEAAVATSSIAPSPPAEALPLVYIAVKAGGVEAGRVAASLRAGLAGFDTVDFIGRPVDGTTDPAKAATSFTFDVLPGPTPGAVTLELQNVATGRVLLSRNLTAAETDASSVEDHIAGILSSVVPASGAIYNYLEQTGAQAGLTECLLLNDKYYLDQSAETHEAAYRCLEKLADQDAKSSLVYSELSALQMEAVTDHYAYPPGASIEQAMSLAHRAITMGPTSPYAHRAYGYLNSRLGNSEESIRWMRKAYVLNTYDLSMTAAYGYGLIFAGDYRQGTPIMARAVDASSAHPTWWDFGLFVGEFMLGDKVQAARATVPLIPTATKSHYLAARLIAARITGDNTLAKEMLLELSTRFPKFAADPRQTFNERRYPADLTDRLVEALRAAGLDSAS